MVNSTLPVSSVVNVAISLAAIAAGPRSFGSLLILGITTGVIDTIERIREYSSTEEVGDDFGVDSDEFAAAMTYFSQSPKPKQLFIGHWDKEGNEALLDAVNDCLDHTNWYGLEITENLTDAEVLSVSGLIESALVSRVFAHTTQDENALSTTSETDIAYKLANTNLRRTLTQFSSTNKYAAGSILGRIFSVNYNGSNTTITLKFKNQPGIAPENLKISESKALAAKNCNVFAKYNNGDSITQEGVMCDGTFIDELVGLDWLQNHLELALWNLYKTTNTKIPQTPDGVNLQCAVLENALEQAVTNGLLGVGQWNGDSFGAIETGDYLDKGYYVYANSLDDQAQYEREARNSVVYQIAIKLAGATHFGDVLVSVNR